MLLSPSNIDVDAHGRVWVCEIVNYRQFRNKNIPVREEGDRILVLEDTDGDGALDEKTVFYQSPEIDSPHGVCVLGDTVIVSAGENVLTFTDADGDLVADEGSRKVLFTGISGVQHDHGIHSVLFGPDGKLYFNFGNEGGQLEHAGRLPGDRSRRQRGQGGRAALPAGHGLPLRSRRLERGDARLGTSATTGNWRSTASVASGSRTTTTTATAAPG